MATIANPFALRYPIRGMESRYAPNVVVEGIVEVVHLVAVVTAIHTNGVWLKRRIQQRPIRIGQREWMRRFKTSYRDKRSTRYMTPHLSKQLRDALSKKYACYVLITCDEPTNEGQMNVEMSYEGDAALAAYLIDGAQEILDAQND